MRFAFWQPRNLASRPEIRHENLRCSVVHIRKTGGYQRQGSELSQVGDILRESGFYSHQFSNPRMIHTWWVCCCCFASTFFLVVPSRCYAKWPGVLWMQLVAPWRFSPGEPHWHDRSNRYPDVAGDLQIGWAPELFLVWVWVKLEKPQNCKLQTEDWHFFFCHRGGECLCQPQLQIRLNRYSEARFFWINCQWISIMIM